MEMTLQSTPVLEDRARLFEELYESTFPVVARFVSGRNGSFQDAKDIFQDALLIFHEKTTAGTREIIASEEAYILGIAKHLWIRKFKSDKRNVSMNGMESLITIPDDFYEEVKSSRLVLLLEHAGKKCMELLNAFYYHKLSMTGIRNKFGYGSEHSAAVQKFKCLEKVRDVVREKSMNYEDFTE